MSQEKRNYYRYDLEALLIKYWFIIPKQIQWKEGQMLEHQELAEPQVHQEHLVLQELVVLQVHLDLQELVVLQELLVQVEQDLIQFKIRKLQEFLLLMELPMVQ